MPSNIFEASTYQIILSINVQFFICLNLNLPAVGRKVSFPAGTFEACLITLWGYVLLQFLIALPDAPKDWAVLAAVVLHPSVFGCWQLGFTSPGQNMPGSCLLSFSYHPRAATRYLCCFRCNLQCLL